MPLWGREVSTACLTWRVRRGSLWEIPRNRTPRYFTRSIGHDSDFPSPVTRHPSPVAVVTGHTSRVLCCVFCVR